MTDRILKILDNVRYWETCPEDYKKDIETFLEAQSQALRIGIVSQQRELLIDFCLKMEEKAMEYKHLVPSEEFIDKYLKGNL